VGEKRIQHLASWLEGSVPREAAIS
jgi:hypothetical protein